ncbi:DUF262 domain-containing protein [Agrobacterium cavarae]|uniref:DUF262 domain-containing protein n=1 Tax=Agrobacterium cavarae TaxID=2528239 RepID=UPI003FD46784
MLLELISNTGEPVQVELKQLQGSDITGEWHSASEEGKLVVRYDELGQIEVVQDGSLRSSDEEIKEQFLALISEMAIVEAGGIEYDDQRHQVAEATFPYDPETIRIDTKPFNISLVYEMINDGDINLSPDFQRQFVWTDVGARSRLIESIMLRIPLPVFYMAEDRSGQLHVVDGLQRLTVIKQFLDNKLRLRELEYLKDEEGKTFRHEDPAKCIDQRYRKRIVQTQIMFNIIDPQTPTDVKFDIFKRINQGGRPLNSQEIRNCMSSPATRRLIGGLAVSDAFLAATQASVGNVRMQDQALVLRALAFRMARSSILPSYSGNMERFLDQAIDVLNLREDLHANLEAGFLRSMRNAEHLFGQYAFRKCFPADLIPGVRRRLINNSLFTTWGAVLADYDSNLLNDDNNNVFGGLVAERLRQDPAYLDSVTSGTNDRRRLSYAFGIADQLCAEHLQ